MERDQSAEVILVLSKWKCEPTQAQVLAQIDWNLQVQSARALVHQQLEITTTQTQETESREQ